MSYINQIQSLIPAGSAASGEQPVLAIGATTIAPIMQLQGSDDAGATWYSIGSTLTSVASSTVQLTVANMNSQMMRVLVQTAGTGTTANYVLLRAF